MYIYKNILIEELNNVYQINNIIETTNYDKHIKELIEKLPDDKLIKKISPKWNKRSKSIELTFDINNLGLFHVDVMYRIAEDKISWRVQYYTIKYDENKSGNKTFIEHLNECIDCIHYEYENCSYNKKITSKHEFSEELINQLRRHISLSQCDKNYKPQEMALGINRENYRPTINKKQLLKNCDIYDLDILIERYYKHSPQPEFAIFWERPLFEDIAEKYIKNDIVERRELYSNNIFKLNKKEFRKAFYDVMYAYLEEKNRINSIIKFCTYLSEYNRLMSKDRFLGICPLTLRPFVGIEEGLDGCDIYDVKDFEKSFKTDENGDFIQTNNGKFILENKNILNNLEAKYFEGKLHSSLPLIKKAEDYIIHKDSEFIALYIGNYKRISFLYSTIMGKYSYSGIETQGKFVYLSIYIYNYVKNIVEAKISDYSKIKLASTYYNEARNYKKQKDYHKAIEFFNKCEELNVGYNVSTELKTCYRLLKKAENEHIVVGEHM